MGRAANTSRYAALYVPSVAPAALETGYKEALLDLRMNSERICLTRTSALSDLIVLFLLATLIHDCVAFEPTEYRQRSVGERMNIFSAF